MVATLKHCLTCTCWAQRDLRDEMTNSREENPMKCACCNVFLDFEHSEYHVKYKKRWCIKCFASAHAESQPDVCPHLPNIKKIQRVLDSVELTAVEADNIKKYVDSRVRIPMMDGHNA